MLVLGFIIFTEKIIAQEQERVVDDMEIQSLLALSESIQSGEIGLIVNQQRKGKSAIETEEYKIIFSKIDKDNKYFEVNFNYNILSLKDSMQYIYNGEMRYIIDHKKKICNIDTVWHNLDCSYSYIFPPVVLANEMFCFYARKNLLEGTFLCAVTITEIQKTENTTFVKIETNRISPDHRINKKGKKVLWTEEYEWNTNKLALLRHSETVKDDTDYSRKTIVKTETLLTDASLNDEKYADSELYNGLNYAKSYKIVYSKW